MKISNASGEGKWEDVATRYRVTAWIDGEVVDHDLTETTFDEAWTWAQNTGSDTATGFGVVVDDPNLGRGVIWIDAPIQS